jgi:hypothetical protein
MPCYEVRTLSVEFHAKNRKLLEQAIDSLCWHRVYDPVYDRIYVADANNLNGFTIDLAQERATVTEGQQRNVNLLKQAYSKAALRKVAKLQGWQLKGERKGVLRR